ncbi:unnamed protein product [Meloidogyne enterolobii]|uniref:Uncharacterized protein n=1 Tax=Meloidogyne enterolobii TaxID=390850 RepID=A0ACB0YE39_MELEN
MEILDLKLFLPSFLLSPLHHPLHKFHDLHLVVDNLFVLEKFDLRKNLDNKISPNPRAVYFEFYYSLMTLLQILLFL